MRDPSRIRRRAFRVLLLAVSMLPGSNLWGQQLPRATYPSLPEHHWAVRAAWRMEALGLVDDFLPASREVPRDAVGQALAEAEARAEEIAHPLATLTRGLSERFEQEFRTARPGAAPPGIPPTLLGSSAGAGYTNSSGLLAPGTGLGGARSEARFVDPGSGAVLHASLAAGVTPYLSLLMEPEYRDGELELQGWDVVARIAPIGLAVGRQPIGYGWGRAGGVVLSETTLDRLQIETTRPLTLPGWLRHLGPASFHLFVSRFSEDRHPGDPYFFGVSGLVQPHARLTLGIHRASMFGGDSVPVATTPRNVGRMLLGIYEGTPGFENQVVSASIRYRLPIDAILPATVYAEWGADDAAGAWWDVPGTIVGIFLPVLPGIPEVAAGLERARFPPACCQNPEWYRHGSHTGHWVTGYRPMGHPLGGHGREWLLYGSAMLVDARLHVDGLLFWRDRGDQNLYAPERIGESRGVTIRASWRVLPFAEVQAYLSRDDGDAWRTHTFRAIMSILF